MNDVKRVSSKIITNTFSASQFQKLNSPITLPDTIVEDAKKVFDIGNQQYQEFVKTRFVLGSEDVINSPITKNNLKLLADSKSISDESPQIKLTPTILTKFRDACDVRNVLAKNTFSQEFTRVPECLIKDGRPYHSNKSDILEVIAPKSKAANPTEVVVRGLVIDLSMIIRSETVVVTSMTFKDFAEHVTKTLRTMSVKIMYKDWILCWTHTMHLVSNHREERGVGSQVLFEYNDPLPDAFNSFLKNDDNKTDPNKLISQIAIRPTSWTWEGEVYVTYGKGVGSRSDGNVDIMRWIYGVHEKADNRIVIHISDMICNCGQWIPMFLLFCWHSCRSSLN